MIDFLAQHFGYQAIKGGSGGYQRLKTTTCNLPKVDCKQAEDGNWIYKSFDATAKRNKIGNLSHFLHEEASWSWKEIYACVVNDPLAQPYLQSGAQQRPPRVRIKPTPPATEPADLFATWEAKAQAKLQQFQPSKPHQPTYLTRRSILPDTLQGPSGLCRQRYHSPVSFATTR